MIQALQPSGPALTLKALPGGSRSQECGSNRSSPSSKLALEHQELGAAGGVERDGPVRPPAFEPNVLALIAKQRNQLHAGRPGVGVNEHRRGVKTDLRAVLRIELPELDKDHAPDADPGVWCDVGGLRMHDPAGKSPCSSWKTPSRTRNSSPPP